MTSTKSTEDGTAPRDSAGDAVRSSRTSPAPSLTCPAPHLPRTSLGPHINWPVHDLSFRDEKSWATAISPILASAAGTFPYPPLRAFGCPARRYPQATQQQFFRWWINAGCTPYPAASPDTVRSPSSASSATRTLTPASRFLFYLLDTKDRQTSDRSFRHDPMSGE